MVEPEDTPVTTPVAGLMVTVEISSEYQTTVPEAVVDKVIVEFKQTELGPVMAGAAGNALMVTVNEHSL